MSKEGHVQQTLFYVSAALDTSYEELCVFYCCWCHKFAITALFCSIHYLFTVDSDMYQQQTHIELCFHCNSCYMNTPQCYITCTLSCF